MNNIVSIFIGGGIGSLARYGIASFVLARFKSVFPIATLTSNVLSCIVLAISVTILQTKIDLSPTWRLLIITGFCGGFSTFSAFSYETVELIRSDNMMYAIANIVISLGVCIGLIYMLAKN